VLKPNLSDSFLKMCNCQLNSTRKARIVEKVRGKRFEGGNTEKVKGKRRKRLKEGNMEKMNRGLT